MEAMRREAAEVRWAGCCSVYRPAALAAAAAGPLGACWCSQLQDAAAAMLPGEPPPCLHAPLLNPVPQLTPAQAEARRQREAAEKEEAARRALEEQRQREQQQLQVCGGIGGRRQ